MMKVVMAAVTLVLRTCCNALHFLGVPFKRTRDAQSGLQHHLGS